MNVVDPILFQCRFHPSTAAMFAPITKHRGYADHPTRIPQVLNECVRQSLGGRRGAVLFEVPDAEVERLFLKLA